MTPNLELWATLLTHLSIELAYLAVELAAAALGLSYLQKLIFLDPEPSEYLKYASLGVATVVVVCVSLLLALLTGSQIVVFINSL